MVQIGTIGRAATARATTGATSRPSQQAPRTVEPARALVALPGGRTEEPRVEPTQKIRGSTRPLAGFLTQMIVSADPTLRPSRLERTGAAAARYAETARLTA